MELQDYSGEFDPDLKMEDFSKETLIRLIVAVNKNYFGQDGLWHAAVTQQYGAEVANSFLERFWAKQDAPSVRDDLRRMLPLFKIEGNDIAALFKYLQVSPTIGIYHFQLKFELINEKHGIMTVLHCPSLHRVETQRRPDLAQLICVKLDEPWIRNLAAYFNPKIKVKTTLELPRKTKDEFPCQFEFTIED